METTVQQAAPTCAGEKIQAGVARIDGRLVGWALFSDDSTQAYLCPRLELVTSDPVYAYRDPAEIKAWLEAYGDRGGAGQALRHRAATILWKVREVLITRFPLTFAHPGSVETLRHVERLSIRLNSERVALGEV